MNDKMLYKLYTRENLNGKLIADIVDKLAEYELLEQTGYLQSMCCDNCKYEDLTVLQEPCWSCIRNGKTQPSDNYEREGQ